MEIKSKPGRPAKKEPDDKIKQLEEQIEQLKKLLLEKNLVQAIEEKVEDETPVDLEDDYVEIKPNKYIKVVSLNFGRLNLTTQPKGQGKLYKFEKYGDVRNIIYPELVEILHNHQKFAEEGRFYVLDKQVVRNHGLVEFYEKILSKDTIDKIFTYSKDQMVDLFNNATQTQKENIVGMLIKRIHAGESIDLNKIDVLSRAYGQNIYELANENKIEE